MGISSGLRIFSRGTPPAVRQQDAGSPCTSSKLGDSPISGSKQTGGPGSGTGRVRALTSRLVRRNAVHSPSNPSPTGRARASTARSSPTTKPSGEEIPSVKDAGRFLKRRGVIMAGLAVHGPGLSGLSGTRQKAAEDANKMQASVREDCAQSGKPMPCYHLTELIGKGSFGRVYKASNTKTNKVVAVKIIDVDESDTLNPKLADTYSEFLKEVNALKVLSEGGAQNINYVLEALPVGHSMWMVTEYCAGGSVATLMKPTAPGGLQEKWIIPILREVAVAVYWVHKHGIIHRDIKCANVLITEVGGVQLCDFGVAGMMETKFDKRSTFIGTQHWMAPELFDPHASYGTEVDIWAFGSMVHELASGLPPNVRANVGLPQFGGYLREHIPRLEGAQYSADLRDLVAFCLVESAKKRPKIQQVQQHPYIFNTSKKYPTSSLSSLVRAYRLWEEGGGSRRSLFNPNIGAQPPSDVASTPLAADEWNFSTTLAFDESIHDNSDGRTDFDAVRDVYGSHVDYPGDVTEETAKPKGKGRRRPPPQVLAAMKAPLEKVFDPNTISSYNENSQAYYGRAPMPPPPPTSDLPLRDDSHHATLRESLIDLDASLAGADMSRFANMDTIRPEHGARASMDNAWSFSSAAAGISSATSPYDLAPPGDALESKRYTPTWQWPTSIPPASTNPDMSPLSFHEDRSDPGSVGRPRLTQQHLEPIGLPPREQDLHLPRPMHDRMSVASLIDLDEGLVGPGLPTLPELTRPSTANSDVPSMTGSDMGGANPFELERHTSVYAPLPLTNREPSIYVSGDSDFANAVAKNNAGIPDLSSLTTINEGARAAQQHNGHNLSDGSGTYVNENENDNVNVNAIDNVHDSDGAYMMPPRLASLNRAGVQLPFVAAPSPAVMEARASAKEIADEMRRLVASMSDHLTYIGDQVARMEPRRAQAPPPRPSDERFSSDLDEEAESN